MNTLSAHLSRVRFSFDMEVVDDVRLLLLSIGASTLSNLLLNVSRELFNDVLLLLLLLLLLILLLVSLGIVAISIEDFNEPVLFFLSKN